MNDDSFLTNSALLDILSVENLRKGGIIMKGTILCARCRKPIPKAGVCQCGSYKCIVKIYHKGRAYDYRRDENGSIFSFHTARDVLIKITGQIKAGSFNPTDFLSGKVTERTFENQVEKWLKAKETQEAMNELSPNTVRQYRGYVYNFFPFFSGMNVREITLEHLSDFKDTLDGVGIKTRRNIMLALHNVFIWMWERGKIEAMPAFPKVKGDDSMPVKSIDPEMQDEILKRIPEKDRDIIEFLYETGLRPGEACYLRVKHIDLRNGVASIEGTFSGTKERSTNKEKRKRQIPISDRAWQIVVKNMESKHPASFLFTNSYTGNHYTTNRLGKIWKKYAGIDDVKLYGATRHSFGSQLVEKYDISLVSELMGHSDIRTTRKYIHARVKKLAAMVNDRKAIFMLAKSENRPEIDPSFNPSKTAFIQ